MSGSQFNEVILNEEDLSYMLDDETTPVKSCGDLAYQATHSGRFFSSILWFLRMFFGLVKGQVVANCLIDMVYWIQVK